MVDKTLDEKKDPLKEIHVLWAIRWIIEAWDEVDPQTIDRCFTKTTLFGPYYGPPTATQALTESFEMSARLLDQLQQANVIHSRISLEGFLNPDEERISDSRPTQVEAAITQAIEIFGGEEVDDNIEQELQPKVPLIEVLGAVEKLILFEEQQEVSNNEFLRQLARYSKDLRLRNVVTGKQAEITAFFRPQV